MIFSARVPGAFVGLVAYLIPTASLAAKPPPPPPPKPMQVVIARSAAADCEPQCLEWIAAQGMIDASTPRQFKKVLAALGQRRLPILIDSAGGSVDDALAIGRMIRAKGLDVIVTQTLFKTCDKADAACNKLKRRDIHLALPHARLSKCASSCAFVLAAGTRRYVGDRTFVGLHQVASFNIRAQVLRTYRITTQYQWGVPVQQQKSLISEKKISETKQAVQTKESTYQRITAYFVEMGISQSVMPILLSTPNSSIRWLRHPELQSTGLATDFVNGEQLLLPAKLVPPPAQPATGNPSSGAPPACDSAAGSTAGCEVSPASLMLQPPVTPPPVEPSGLPVTVAPTLPPAAQPVAPSGPAPVAATPGPPAAAVKASTAPAKRTVEPKPRNRPRDNEESPLTSR